MILPNKQDFYKKKLEILLEHFFVFRFIRDPINVVIVMIKGLFIQIDSSVSKKRKTQMQNISKKVLLNMKN